MYRSVFFALLLGVLLTSQFTQASFLEKILAPFYSYPIQKTALISLQQSTSPDETIWYNLLDNTTDPGIVLNSSQNLLSMQGSGTVIGIGQTLQASGLQSLEFTFGNTSGKICFGVVENLNPTITTTTILENYERFNVICTDNTQGSLFAIVDSTTGPQQTIKLLIDYVNWQIVFVDETGDGYWVGDFVFPEYCYIVYAFENAGTFTVDKIVIDTQAVNSQVTALTPVEIAEEESFEMGTSEQEVAQLTRQLRDAFAIAGIPSESSIADEAGEGSFGSSAGRITSYAPAATSATGSNATETTETSESSGAGSNSTETTESSETTGSNSTETTETSGSNSTESTESSESTGSNSTETTETSGSNSTESTESSESTGSNSTETTESSGTGSNSTETTETSESTTSNSTESSESTGSNSTETTETSGSNSTESAESSESTGSNSTETAESSGTGSNSTETTETTESSGTGATSTETAESSGAGSNSTETTESSTSS